MKTEHQEILKLLEDYLESQPDLRFGQALFNLGVNQFVEPFDYNATRHQIRDIHGDSDKRILERIKNSLQWFELQRTVMSKTEGVSNLSAMTVNERLHATGLFDLFDNYKSSNKRYAGHILSALKVSSADIEEILKK